MKKFLSNFTAGTVSALVTLSYAASYGVLIFSAPELHAQLGAGLHMALMAAWLVALVVAAGSSFSFAIAGPDSNATAILAVMAAEMAEKLARGGAGHEQIAASVIAMLLLSAVLTGSITFLIGALKRGSLVRFLPYTVVGGFLAGTGYLIFAGGFKVLMGAAPSMQSFRAIENVPPLALECAAFVAITLLVAPRFVKHYLVMPAVLVAGVALFFAGLHFYGMDIAGARERGLLFEPLAAAGSLSPFHGISMGSVQWDALAEQWQNFLVMTIVVIITILLNATGIDLEGQDDVDFDRELRVNGAANILSGLGGGIIGYLSISRSLLNLKAGAQSRAAGFITAGLCFCAAFLFPSVVSYFPRPVLAGLLLYLGVSMLREWVWDSFFKLPKLEYALIVSIMLIIAAKGLMPGVGFGLLVACVFFAVNYSRASCIRHSFTGSMHLSNKERSVEETAFLKEKGACVRAITLQGYLFFGTTSAIVDACREKIQKERLRFLLLDFRMAQGMDVSAVSGFSKLEQICRRHNAALLLTGLRKEIHVMLAQSELLKKPDIKIFPDMDRGMEWVEDCLLEERKEKRDAGTEKKATVSLQKILAKDFDESSVNVLLSYCETLELEENAALFKSGDAGDSLYFIEHGEVSVLLHLEDGKTLRLRTFGAGTIVGEMGLYLGVPRSADVFADTQCVIKKLSREKLSQLEREHPDVANPFHRFVIEHLSSRLAAANEEIQILL